MLILSRKVDEKIIIGEDITITIIETRGDQVKIGIEAPKNVKVFRQEIFDEIQNENKAAVAITNENQQKFAIDAVSALAKLIKK